MTAVRTYRDVATELGISRTRVVQLERSAIQKLSVALDLPSPFATKTRPSGAKRLVKK